MASLLLSSSTNCSTTINISKFGDIYMFPKCRWIFDYLDMTVSMVVNIYKGKTTFEGYRTSTKLPNLHSSGIPKGPSPIKVMK